MAKNHKDKFNGGIPCASSIQIHLTKGGMLKEKAEEIRKKNRDANCFPQSFIFGEDRPKPVIGQEHLVATGPFTAGVHLGNVTINVTDPRENIKTITINTPEHPEDILLHVGSGEFEGTVSEPGNYRVIITYEDRIHHIHQIVETFKIYSYPEINFGNDWLTVEDRGQEITKITVNLPNGNQKTYPGGTHFQKHYEIPGTYEIFVEFLGPGREALQLHKSFQIFEPSTSDCFS